MSKSKMTAPKDTTSAIDAAPVTDMTVQDAPKADTAHPYDVSYASRFGTYDAKLHGPMPTAQDFADVALFGLRAGTSNAFALALTLRQGGSTRGQRTIGGDPKDNFGAARNILQAQHGKQRQYGTTYRLTLASGAIVDAVCNAPGHTALTVISRPGDKADAQPTA